MQQACYSNPVSHSIMSTAAACLQRLLSYENAASVMYSGSASVDQQHQQQHGQADLSADQQSSSAASAALSAGVARLLMQLLDNLEVKSRAYKNDALAALFMMNNVHYVQWSVETSPAALELLGADWLERHKDAVEDWGAKYHDTTWMPLINMLKVCFTIMPWADYQMCTIQRCFRAPDAAARACYCLAAAPHSDAWQLDDAGTAQYTCQGLFQCGMLVSTHCQKCTMV